jgi:DNA recombination protein RmuC
MNPLLLFLTGVLSGLIAGYFIAKATRSHRGAQADDLRTIKYLEGQIQAESDGKKRIEESLESYRKAAEENKSQVEVLKEQLRSQEQQKAFLENARNDLKTQFEALTSQMLKSSREELVNTTKTSLTDPFTIQVKTLQEKVEELQKNSLQRLDVLQSTTRDLIQRSADVQGAAQQLTSALRSPNVKGRWGEMNLKRILEFVGLIPYCDFEEQLHVADIDGASRPDCVITIPGNRKLIIDSKAPLDSYLDAMQASDESQKRGALVEHAKKVRLHIDSLSKKDYVSRMRSSGQIIEGVVLFIPVEGALSVALETDPGLIEYAFQKSIIVTFPTSLLAVLKGLSLTIQQQEVAENVHAIKDMAIEMNRRFVKFADLYSKVGLRLRQLTEDYNSSVGSFNGRLLVQSKKFAELGGIELNKPNIDTVDAAPRLPQVETDQG